MYDDVLIPTDGSETVPEALDHALPIATDNDATVHALYVVDSRITAAADRETREEVEASLEREGTAAVEAVEDAATEAGLDSTTAIRKATPWRGILDYAAETDVDLIVIGSHGKTPREKITSLGSVSERVVDGAEIPVLVVRSPDGG
ncbi:universal stress protein [Halalkaliarchaeum desulfuricum]|nr:universal stress protein [Halalkaliarchaeum desulfuricum]